MKNTITKEDFYEYFDKGLKVIPVGESEKGYGKRPLPNNYLALPWDEMGDPYDVVDQWFERFGDGITGLGVVLGPTQNPGLCCIDIDTEDEEIIAKIFKYFGTKIKKRGGKGWTLFFQTDGKNQRNYYKFQCPGNLGIIEVFYDKRQIVLPPSWYHGETIYRWEDDYCTLLTVDIDELPMLPSEWVEGIGTLIGSPTTATANLSLPKSKQFKDGQNRTIAINELLGRIFKANPNPDINEVASELLTYDATHFPDNSFFLDPRKAHNKTNNRSVNIMGYLASMSASFWNKSGTEGFEFNSPVETKTIVFRKLVPVTEAHFEKEEGVPEFDKTLIPDCWRGMVDEICEGQGVPHQGVFMSMLTGLGATLQGNTVIRPTKTEPFFRRTNLACAMVATSGSKKSDVVRNALYEIKKIDKTIKNSNSKEDLNAIQDLEFRLEKLVKEKKKGEDLEKINEEILKVYAELEAKPLKGTKFVYENAPIQKMILDAKKNQKTGLLIVKDEMKQIFADFKKKGNEDSRTFYMKGFDGNDSFSYSTISRGDDTVEKHVLSLLTNVQPDVLNVYIQSLYSAYGENDGFLQRIILVPFGDIPVVKPRPVDFKRFAKQYEHFNRAFYSAEAEVTIHPDALDYYLDLRHRINLYASKYKGQPVVSFLSKHEGLLCVFGYLYEFLNSEGRPTTISRESLDLAMRLLQYLGDCAKHLFEIKDKQHDHDAMVQVASMLCNRHFKSGATQSEIYQGLRGAIKFPQTFYNALKDLELRGYVALEYSKQNSVFLHINPEVYSL